MSVETSVPDSQIQPADEADDPTGRPPRRVVGVLAEAVAAFGAAAAVLQLSRSVTVDPLDRVGQVAGLAGLDLRFVLLGLAVLAIVALTVRARPAAREIVVRCAFAAVAGLCTGLVAAGILLALRGTDWPLLANFGDSGQLIRWADDLVAGRPVPDNYPPAVIQTLARGSQLTGLPTSEMLRGVQVLVTAAFGPIAYLAWRLLLPAPWALAIMLLAAFPLLEPYKPYTVIMLVVLVPVVIATLAQVRRAAELSWRRIAVVGIASGVVLGLVFTVYSGWFVWSAPGALVAVLIVMPWRTAALRGLALLALAGVAMVVVAAPHLFGLLAATQYLVDRYFYFDTLVDPAYVAMSRGDLSGDPGPWPPPGELAGVGVFPLLLVVGLGAALALAAHRTTVLTLALLLAGAWVMRFHFASQMYDAQAVQLWPRTTGEIFFCLVALTVLAVRHGVQHLPAVPGPPLVVLGPLAAALLLGLFMGSSHADEYLPRNDNSPGFLAYAAQMVRQPDGTCPDYVTDCAENVPELYARP